MSLNTKYTNLNEILERVRRDFGFEDVYPDECKEWIWDIIGYMGAPEMLIDKEVPLVTKNWRVELPVDVYDLTEHLLKDTDTGRILTYSSDSFHMSNSTAEDVEDVEIEAGRSVTYEEGERESSEETIYNSVIVPSHQVISNLAPTYKINNNYIFTSLREMNLLLTYRAFPMDEEKLEPLIPDNPKVIRAVVYFIAEKIALRLMLMDKLSERKYGIIKQEALFNTGAAITSARISTIPEMENLKNRINTIYRNQHPFRTGFRE